MSIDTPIGRRMKANVLTHGNPLIRIPREEVAGAGIEFTPRLAGTRDGKPQTEDGRALPAKGLSGRPVSAPTTVDQPASVRRVRLSAA